MFSKVAIGLSIAVAAFAGVYVSRNHIARSFPGIPAYYSVDGDIFTFDHIFRSGSVGPFLVGASKEDLFVSLDRYGKSFILTMPMNKEDGEKLYYSRQTVVLPEARRVLLASNEWKIAFQEQGAVTIYHVRFYENRAKNIRLVSTLGA